MKRYFPGDDRKNKAAMLLASMSPDMVDDIVNLCQSQGNSLAAILNDGDSGPKPLALFSRSFINDEDFPAVYIGATTVMLGSFRTLTHDAEFYKKSLSDAFSLPDSMAEALAEKIETYDRIGGTKEARAAMGWFDRLTARAAETIRKGANYLPSILQIPWYNDQDQKYDIDFLYELKLLGQTVDELQSRSRLITGQAGAAYAMGLFQGHGGTSIYKGLLAGGDVVDDDAAAEYDVLTAAKPLMGDVLPKSVFGGLGNLVEGAKAFAKKNLNKLIGKGDDADEGSPTHVAAYDRLSQGIEGPSKAAECARDGVPIPALLNLIKQYVSSPGQTGDVGDHIVSRIAADYGDVVAEHYRNGDLPAAVTAVIQQADGDLPTTGDDDLDEQITGDVMAEEDSVDTDPEVGGLFKRLRTKIKLKRARNLMRKQMRRGSKQRRKDIQNQEFIDANDQISRAKQWAPGNAEDMDEAMAAYQSRPFRNPIVYRQPAYPEFPGDSMPAEMGPENNWGGYPPNSYPFGNETPDYFSGMDFAPVPAPSE